MTLEKTLVTSASIFVMLCMPLLVSCTQAKPRGVELQAIEKITDDVKTAKAKVEKLKKKFHISTDRFTNITTYRHKKIIIWGITHFTGVPLPIIIDKGEVVTLLGQAYLHEAVRPDTIIIKIGDKVTTYGILLSDTERLDGYYDTRIAFPDDSLLRQIVSQAKEIKSSGINIRFSGGDRYRDYNSDYRLRRENERYIEIVTETLELYDALQIIKKGSEQQDGD